MKQQQARLAALSRRNFLKHSAGTGLVIGAGPLLSSCFGGGDTADDSVPSTGTEKRTYYFNLSNADAQSDHFLVAGTTHHPLKPVDAAALAKARADNPALSNVADASLTHVGEALDMPAAAIQVCYVKSVPKGAGSAGAWAMHSMFYHVPEAATAKVAQGFAKQAQACARTTATSCRQAFMASTLAAGVSGGDFCNDPAYAAYKDYFDHAVALVLNHPEICSFDPPTLAYVHTLVCADATLMNLAVSLFRQGPATLSGGWATLVPFTDPATGQPKLATTGAPLYLTQHSATTLQLTGIVIRSVLPKVKNDPQLGANVTSLSTTEVNSGLQGKMWTVRNGTPTRRAAPAAVAAASRAGVLKDVIVGAGGGFASLDLSGGNGFRFSGVTGDATARTVTFTAENWYLRFLGLYIRFLDGAGNPLPLSGLDSTTMKQFPSSSLNGTYDCFLGVQNQELVILGIPIQQASKTFTITVPAAAASVKLLAGGLGVGTSSYPDTLMPGIAMTVAFDMALPGLFLAMAAAQGYGTITRQIVGMAPGVLVGILQAVLTAFVDIGLNTHYNDLALYNNVLIKLGTVLLSATASGIGLLITEALGEGVAIGAAEDTIPFGIGLIIQAVMAVTTAGQIAQTSLDVATSPPTYVTSVALTHDLAVTINHDPRDTAGFPATATSYRLTAVCDGGSPYDSGSIAMPGTTQTAPLTYTFVGMPSGGLADITVNFTAPDGWLAGAGTAIGVDNTLNAASVTITEILVPLNAATRYGHKQKTALGNAGQHIWTPTAQAPAAQPPNPNNQPGSLLGLTGITLSEPFASIGYSWQAYSAAVASFAGGAQGQLYQFANISFTQNPQQAYLFSGQGFQSPARLAYSRSGGAGGNNYYIDSSGGQFIVRLVNLTGVATTPTFDSPSSGRAVGRFNFASDAFLVHPTGKLISFNSELSKMEMIAEPADPPVDDASAPLAQAMAGPGTREGLLSGPVCAAAALDGTILVLEQANNRIQAFDTGANATHYFTDPSGNLTSVMPLSVPGASATPNYLDLAVESTGFIYVLSQDTQTTLYNLDIYNPAGQWVNRTSGVNASKLAVDLFRNVYTLNMETLQPATQITEPSVSQWIPSTP